MALPLSESRFRGSAAYITLHSTKSHHEENYDTEAPRHHGRSVERTPHDAGRKSIGYEIVTVRTPSFSPKLIPLTRSTTCAARSGAFMSLDCSAHIDTLPSGSIVRRRIIWPCKVGLLRSSRL